MLLVLIRKYFDKLAMMSTEEYMKRFCNPKLKSILTSQWGNYGLPPSQSTFMIHGLIVNHFINGGYYPEGGSGKIAETILPQIRNNGGEALVHTNVTNIIIKNNRAIGVTVDLNEKGHVLTRQYYAPVIVSCAGAYNTFTKLIADNRKIKFTADCSKINKPSVCVALYLGLKGDVRSLGITGANCWIYDSFDHDTNYQNTDLLKGKPSSCFISFVPSQKDPTIFSTATVIASTSYSFFEKWRDQPRGKRDKDYYVLKEVIAKGLIDFVNTTFPGFSSLIDYYELGTPLSAENFTKSFEGAMYGLPASSERYKQKWLAAETPIEGLYLTGSDISSLGIVPSMLSGVATASRLNGPFGFFKIVAHIRRKCRSMPKQKVKSL
jgi:phytoene dehydrogenase-like protein